ncbi:MAG: TlpA family protein disulfide reductase, partial [Lachnospiraceae bacterium]|nr:TlpA family protein disulfide reductase [Lachnospiraceae bacterium]
PDNVQLITVCLDGDGDMEGVKSILDDAGYEGVTLLSGKGDFEEVCGEILYIPTTILVDQNGNMLGDAIIGGQADLAETYMTAINNALLSMGKAEMNGEAN